MKKIKLIIIALIFITINGKARAATAILNDDHLSINYAIDTYLDALSHGHNKELGKILDDNLKYTLTYGTETRVLDKSDVLSFFKDMAGIEQDCAITTVTDDKTPDVTILKVYMKYKSFTRLNYVTMVNSVSGWKITNVYSVVQQKNDKIKISPKTGFKQR